jgi:hypothetical protein
MRWGNLAVSWALLPVHPSLHWSPPVSDQAVRVVWFGMLLVHGLGHFGAVAALAWLAARPGTATGAWTAARSWLVPSLAPGTATLPSPASGYGARDGHRHTAAWHPGPDHEAYGPS